MTEPLDDAFADRFLDDFFAESEEHLTAIRRNLLALEAAVPAGRAAADTLEEMFRSFHSLKGISGMVRLEDAETLAHDMESYLRALRSGEARLSAAGVEALIEGTRVLDEVIAARRNNGPRPDTAALRARLGAISSPTRPHAASRHDTSVGRPADATPTSVARPSGNVWRVTFVPSNDLLARGVNVNVVRERLRSTGRIVEARPKITGAGGIAFQFLVETDTPNVLNQWLQDGVSYEPVSLPSDDVPAPAPPPASPDPAAPAASASAPGRPSVSRFVRVDLSRLDDVMGHIADIVVTRTRLDEALERAEDRMPHGEWRTLEEANQALERQLRRLRDAVMRVRMVPVGEIFSKMPFVVRDLARENGKQVSLDLRGHQTEIDKFLIERMMDPIVHLVRNAISHGIEPPEERVARGKPPMGTIGLRAATVGDSVIIEVEDDGRGIDRDAVVARARQAGLDVPATVDAAALLTLLCAPGLSTRDEADRASGRGVGMAVVREAISQLSGSLDVESEPGRGTRFTITLPVTLAIIDALICRIGGQRFAVPQTAVREVLAVTAEAIRTFERNEIFPFRGATLPLARVADLLNLDRAAADGRLHVIVVGIGSQAVGLGVDRILGQREIVVRAITDPLMRVDGVSGATELGDGQPLLILDPPALVRMARRERPAAVAARGGER